MKLYHVTSGKKAKMKIEMSDGFIVTIPKDETISRQIQKLDKLIYCNRYHKLRWAFKGEYALCPICKIKWLKRKDG